jgi:glucose-6-phosphate-specific signal transduction histidine kinase
VVARERGLSDRVTNTIVVIAIFSALLLLLLLIDYLAISRRAKTVLRFVLALVAIALAFQLGSWEGTVLLVSTVAAVELRRLFRKRVKARA